MDKFYYLVSQLPRLIFDRTFSFTERHFLDEAEKWLNRKDFGTLAAVRLNGSAPFRKGPPVWQAYQRFELDFRRELAHWRQAQRDGQDYKPAVFPAALVREGDPLAVEKKLLRYRWDTIEALETEHHFDMNVLILYFLKLQILHRLSVFQKEGGREVFDRLIERNPMPPGSVDSSSGSAEREPDKERS